MNRSGGLRIACALGLRVVSILITLMTAGGCGGPQSLTGGSIPIGSSSLLGTVVRADNVSRQVAGVQVTLSMDASHTATRTTDANGQFVFQQIIGGDYACAITPPAGSDLGQNWVWVFNLPDSTRAQIVAAVWPRSFNAYQVNSVALTPTQTTLHVGQSMRFDTSVLNETGQALSMRPSLLLLGDIGDLSADGVLLARTPGHGTLVAWVNGRASTADITVVP